jgi:hypothetical protein
VRQAGISSASTLAALEVGRIHAIRGHLLLKHKLSGGKTEPQVCMIDAGDPDEVMKPLTGQCLA